MSAKDYRMRLDLPDREPVYLWTIVPLADRELWAALIDATEGTPFRVEVKLRDDWHEIDPKEH